MRRHHLLPSVGRHVAGLALLAAGLTTPITALAIDSQLDAGMPLVLKDGRIANVTVHTIPFETGKGDLAAPAAAALRRLVEPMATDCFLTAQAIGHVEPGVTRDGDTLSAHRLARARADNIQATLASLGMPQAAVASVWDWQFLEEKSQVTLWVFSLNVGDDCGGVPLEQVQAEVAVAPATTERVRPVRRAAGDQPVETPVTPPSELRVSDAVAAPARPATAQSSTTATDAATRQAPPAVTVDQTIVPAETAPAPRRDTATAGATSAPPASPAADPLATAAVAPAKPPAPAATEAPAATTQPIEPEPVATQPIPAQPTEVASAAPGRLASTGGNAGASLAIPFDVNSSFFPSGAGRELRGFLEGLPAASAVEIELAGAVGTGSVRGASGEEAQRYNAWMAERRIERVAEWLEANAGDRQLTLTPRLVENDTSREVRLRAVAIP